MLHLENKLKLIELTYEELNSYNGGGPIIDGIKTYYQTMGSFYRGVWDALTGNEPVV